VILVDEWPSRSETALRWTPFPSQCVAALWRRVWTLTPLRPGLLILAGADPDLIVEQVDDVRKAVEAPRYGTH
jgi:hypothetical protein